ncbi:hypothetical protein EJV47_20545 [Hymenobacter gummosus]|uniref:Haem-binding uptake Tiki superfamily ChaN domain-containing protein n=1 Tax=Hymenobacter gummosus TaxID=1776032 RepID=A0A431TXS0_9BACT|nr:hypothetical protein [Hymenobacter gummosus]RTQ46766.1 hypothetical protein EJV47_20545 [Hymenobacter gummosus]
MKTHFPALLIGLLTAAAAPALAQSPASLPPSPCDQQLVGYARQGAAPASWNYVRATAGGGSVAYFGAEHSQDPGHEQFARLLRAFEAARPTVVFFEGPNRGVDSTAAGTISQYGESGYVRWLARQRGLPVEPLDNPVAEYQYLKAKIDLEQLKLFYLLREAQRLRTRTGATQAQIVQATEKLLARSAQVLPGSDQVIRTVAELETAYRKYWSDGSNWWEAPAAWFDPAASSPTTSTAPPASFATCTCTAPWPPKPGPVSAFLPWWAATTYPPRPPRWTAPCPGNSLA